MQGSTTLSTNSTTYKKINVKQKIKFNQILFTKKQTNTIIQNRCDINEKIYNNTNNINSNSNNFNTIRIPNIQKKHKRPKRIQRKL